jgi:hypothetical protein
MTVYGPWWIGLKFMMLLISEPIACPREATHGGQHGIVEQVAT